MTGITNLLLKSNIYPSKDKYLAYDEKYLKNIQSPLLLNKFREKYQLLNLPSFWTSDQKLLRFTSRHNPHNGIIKENGLNHFFFDLNVPIENYILYNQSDYDYIYSLKNYNLYDTSSDTVKNDYKNSETSYTKIDIVEKSHIIIENPIDINVLLKNDITTYDENETENSEDETVATISVDIENETESNREKKLVDLFIETEQEQIIQADSDNVIFVDAGPGTGKTYVLIQRLIYLVDKCGIDAESILVLCFTNAAVNEIRERLQKAVRDGADRSLSNIDIRTFHSFAWWLLHQAQELKWKNSDLAGMTYDSTIKTANLIMSQKNWYEQVVENWNHFIVDEIQDLTNNLARFVLYIVNACLGKCGITLLGDSCQAIYDYTLKDDKTPLSSEEFYGALIRKISDTGMFFKLTKNHRQTNELISLSNLLRDKILQGDITQMSGEVCDLSNRVHFINENYSNIIPSNLYKQEKENLPDNGRICLMCRNNGQTLRLSSFFRKKNIDHFLNLDATDNNYSPWISEIFCNYEVKTINKTDFVKKFARLRHADYPDVEAIWSKISYILKSDDTFYINDILKYIESSKKDDPLFRTDFNGNIIVSNIHRTKGREYEHVIIDNNFIEDLSKPPNEIGEYKTLYVGLTRAKKTIGFALLSEYKNKIGVYPISIFKTHRRRYGRIKTSKLINLELIPSVDIDLLSFLTISSTVQDYLKLICIGDHIELIKRKSNTLPDYDIVHQYEDKRTVIGSLNDSFAEDISARMNINNYIDFPDTISDLYVSGKYSYIANKDYLSLHPEILKYSPNGVWQWVEFMGIGHLSYEVY